MKELRISVKDKIATLESDVCLVCGNSDYRVIFDFDEDWVEYNAKTALFVFGTETIEVPFFGNTIEEKDAVAIEGATTCYIGVFSGDMVTTTKAEIKCIPSIRDIAQTPKPPKEDVYNKIINLINDIKLGGSAIIDVEELPTEDINNALLYRTAEGIYWYDGEWQKVTDEADLAIIEGRIDTVESIAKGANQALSFGDYPTMIDVFNDLPKDKYRVGQNVYIVELGVPDLWISEIKDTSVKYDIELEGGYNVFKSGLEANGSYQVGYYVLSRLETQKVDLTNYVKFTDEPGNTVAGGKPGVIGLNYATSCGLRVVGTAGKRYLTVYAGEMTDVLRRNGACVLTLSNMDSRVIAVLTGHREKQVDGVWTESYGNQPTLTDEEKSSVAKWFGVPNAYEVDNPEMVVDIPFTYGPAISLNPDEIAYLVSDKTFTKEELLSNGFPFYFEVQNTSSGIKQIFGLAQAVIGEGNGYIKIQKRIDNCDVTAYIVYDNTAGFIGEGGTYPPSNGIYFVSCSWHNYRFERLYRDGKGTKTIDNIYLDLANHPTIKALMARIEALDNK